MSRRSLVVCIAVNERGKNEGSKAVITAMATLEIRKPHKPREIPVYALDTVAICCHAAANPTPLYRLPVYGPVFLPQPVARRVPDAVAPKPQQTQELTQAPAQAPGSKQKMKHVTWSYDLSDYSAWSTPAPAPAARPTASAPQGRADDDDEMLARAIELSRWDCGGSAMHYSHGLDSGAGPAGGSRETDGDAALALWLAAGGAPPAQDTPARDATDTTGDAALALWLTAEGEMHAQAPPTHVAVDTSRDADLARELGLEEARRNAEYARLREEQAARERQLAEDYAYALQFVQ